MRLDNADKVAVIVGERDDSLELVDIDDSDESGDTVPVGVAESVGDSVVIVENVCGTSLGDRVPDTDNVLVALVDGDIVVEAVFVNDLRALAVDERDMIGSVADAVFEALHVPELRGDLDGDPVAEGDPLGKPEESTVNV